MTETLKATVIETKKLTKKYDDTVVVNEVNLEIYRGECFGLLGPNGAGKSTLLKMLYGSVRITSGELFILGLNGKQSIQEIKSRIGVVPQDDALDDAFTVKDNLRQFGRYHQIKEREISERVEELLKLVRLEEKQEMLPRLLSGGMKRRLAIARGLINRPEILILDEPTTGLDPQARLWIWEFLERIKQNMGTVVITTHYMEEAERICDRIAIVDAGRIVTIGKPQKLIRENIGETVIEFDIAPGDHNYYSRRLEASGYSFQSSQHQIHVHLQPGQEAAAVLSQVSSSKVTVRKAALNDVFLKLTGQELREGVQ